MANLTRVRQQAPDIVIPKLTANQSIITDIANTMIRVPPDVNDTYVKIVQRAAASLGNPSSMTIKTQLSSGLKNRVDEMIVPVGVSPGSKSSPTAPVFISDENAAAVRNAALAARNNVIDVITRVNSFIAKAKNLGHAPPSNPFLEIGQLNRGRTVIFDQLALDENLANDLVTSISVYLKLLKADASGALDLSKNTFSAAQLSSANISFDGFGGSGNPALDILRFVPDMAAVKEQKALDALSVLDFKKRVPRVVFTSDYAPNGKNMASIVGWRRIADASGYIIRRKNLFSGDETSFTLTNEDARVRYESIVDYVRAWILTFYDSIDPSTLFAFLDQSIEPNTFYMYTVQAYQIQNQGQSSIFDVDTRPVSLSRQLFEGKFVKQLDAISPTGESSAISPYPVITKQLLDDENYDWLVAGVNVRSSIKRADDLQITRKYSYLASQLNFLFSQMESQKFFVPVDVNQIVKNVNSSIDKFGVIQTLKEIMRDVGIFYYFAGKDGPIDDPHFRRIGDSDPSVDNIISTIAAAIDPDTATLDIKTLMSNLPGLVSGGGAFPGSSKVAGADPRTQSKPTEIDLPGGANTTGEFPPDVQFLREIGDITNNRIDLTTFDGISKLIRTIRIFSDFGSNRGTPFVANPDDVTSSILDKSGN